ncbi:hypothetical protein RJ640_015731 [Escallonia rubra]|uniref:Small nuclear ribonucleoprotein E n=1 Tax=Escallonia rubra TaxID=112253 RepID=A0AA88RY44_9ASTE|nr:hypothetical protein RJ640_015731 [Escallonia rubra]
MASTKVQRIMTQPINLIFRFLQSKARIQIWLFEQKDLRIEGRIIVCTTSAVLRIEGTASAAELSNMIYKFCVANGRTADALGFDEYMNLVLDDAEEVSIKKKTRKQLGRILLKGDNITLMMNT